MIASDELNTLTPGVLKACHGFILLFFGVAVVFAGIKIPKLRSTSDGYQARLFTFGYLSLGAWILWIFQYAILSAPFLPFPSGSSMATVLWLGVVQNAVWVCAILALPFKVFSRKLVTLSLLAVFSALIAVVAYKTTILSTTVFYDWVAAFDGFLILPIFMILSISILQLSFSRMSAAAFLIHGYSQWGWRWLWFGPWATSPLVQLGFPLWRVLLFFAWTKVLSEMAEGTQPPEEKLAPPPTQPPRDLPHQNTFNFLVTLKVMISSTVDDLGPEREAADRAISGLKLDRFRAENLGSFPHPPEMICAFMAEQCDIFVLIIGERYGYEIKSRKKSVVEFEYDVARAQNRGKILVYIKEGVTREPRLEEFVKRLEDFEDGHFRTLFKTAEELTQKIQGDIARWILLHSPSKRPE